ncbi:MAG: hypothetical protein AAF823_07365 [Planctomycetota bacterium]
MTRRHRHAHRIVDYPGDLGELARDFAPTRRATRRWLWLTAAITPAAAAFVALALVLFADPPAPPPPRPDATQSASAQAPSPSFVAVPRSPRVAALTPPARPAALAADRSRPATSLSRPISSAPRPTLARVRSLSFTSLGVPKFTSTRSASNADYPSS